MEHCCDILGFGFAGNEQLASSKLEEKEGQ